MVLNIFSKYRVKYSCKYSYLNEYRDFSFGEESWEKEMSCVEIINWLSKLLNDDEFISINTVNNGIFIQFFSANTGETSDCLIKWQELEGEDDTAN